MAVSQIERDWEVFAENGKPGIGAVRDRRGQAFTIYIEGYGDIDITAEQIAEAHDGKVVIDASSLPADVQHAIAHAHDGETR